MTIHNLMNTMNVSPEVEIAVYNDTEDFCYYIGKYEDSTPGLYNMEISRFNVFQMEENKRGLLWVTKVEIYVE